MREIKEAVSSVYSAGNRKVVLMHCISEYPPLIENLNLSVIQKLEQMFKIPIGFSDHTTSVSIPLAAVALGAKVIEKHIILTTRRQVPDAACSVTPEEFESMVKSIREFEKALGYPLRRPTSSELELRKSARRSLVAREYIPAGTELTREMIGIKRPGTGIPPKFLDDVVSSTTLVDLKPDDILQWDQLSIKRSKEHWSRFP
jgi:N-acetylneuraminate synthase/N,N'-diacetyllegionaminate synthase